MTSLGPLSAGGTGRLPELDIYRGLALVLMVLIHNMFTWTPLALRQWPGPWQVGDLYFGMSASLFYAASGATVFVSLCRRVASGAQPNGLWPRVVSRAILLYAIGIAFEQVWYAPPYDITFFAELNTIAVIGVLVFLFVMRDRGIRFLMGVMIGMVSTFFVVRYALRLAPLDARLYAISPIWSDTPLPFTAEYPFVKLALEFGYSFSIWGSFGILGVILAKLLLDGKIGSRLLMLALGLMAAGYLVEFGLLDPFQKFPVSASYFLLAEGFTIVVFFIARAFALFPATFPRLVATPLAAAGRYALPLYFAHYLVIFASEATGIASTVRNTTSELAAYFVGLILVGIVLALLVIVGVADRFGLAFPAVKFFPGPTKRCIAAGIVAAGIVAYLAEAEPLYSLAGIGSESPMVFLVVGTTIPVLWYAAYKAAV